MITTGARERSANWILIFTCSAILLVIFRGSIEGDVRFGAVVACLVAGASVVSMIRVNSDRPISVGSVYAALFGMFHAGLLIPIAVGYAPRLLNASDAAWVSSPGFAKASFLVALAQTSVSLGYLARSCMKHGGLVTREATPRSITPVDGSAVVGLTMLLTGLGIWTKNVIFAGVSWGEAYSSFLALTAKTNMPTAYLLIGFGMGVVSSSKWVAVRRTAIIAFSLWAFPAFLLGLRGEVIIPASAFLVVASRRRWIRLRLWMAACVIVVLSIGSAVRVVRRTGVAHSPLAIADFSPLNGVAELGYSIRPLVVVSDYHERYGQPFVGIATYLAPFRRFIIGRLLDGQVLSVGNDPSVFGGWIMRYVGPIGGSPAAEAYRAGGALAMIGVMAIIGFTLASLDFARGKMMADALVGMITFVLLLWVRNDFTPVPAECFLALLVLAAVWILDQRSGGRSVDTPIRVRTS